MDDLSRKAGGLFDACRRLAQSLLRAGDDVQAFGVAGPESGVGPADWSPVPILPAPWRIHPRLGYAPALNKSLAAFGPAVVHTHGLWTYTSVVSMRWRNQTGRPEVIHPHGMLDPWALNHSGWKKRVALLAFERQHLKRASCIRALCQSELESIRGFDLKNPVCVIPNGVDLPAIGAQTAEPRFSAKVLLYLGRLHVKKGLANLIVAWDRVRTTKAGASWSLAIAGWDQAGHEQELKDLATRLSIPWIDSRSSGFGKNNPASIQFLGPRFGADKEDLYRSCDAFILPSLSEGLPMVILEAWAHGKPVLMTPMCNLPEGFSTRSAIKIQPDSEAIFQGLTTLSSLSPSELEEMGRAGLQLVKSKFTWSQVSTLLDAVNRWLVHGEHRPDFVEV